MYLTNSKIYVSITFLCSLCFLQGFAQKGLPPKERTQASVNTNFPQHEDFKENMVSRLIVPAAFKVEVAASGLGKPRMMVIDDKGSMYVTRRDQGDVLLLNDKDGDGKFDEMKTVVTQFKGVHGIAIHNKYLYLCANNELKRALIKPDGTLEELDTLINDLPDGGQHGNRTIAFGPDGMLYITVGSDCNDCNETNPEHATILIANADGSNRKIFSRGLRNTIGFDWHPQTKELWGMDNGTDWRGDDLPPEELNKIVEGGDYGWPLVYGKQQVDETREDPAGTTKAAYAKTTQPAALLLPAHSAPINFLFLNKATAFPAEYKNDALVTLHGSWNKKNPDGYKIIYVHFENGQPVSTKDFLTGFISKDGKTRFGRPAGLAISSKRNLYIS
ncbi:MAG: PQQ-dependent sugar dehydrogenase, partial [Chitinophagaceae bacterium]|nr:PQQ-dependent sugar dehydrogenase [Chitinophagaceae bacterium]